MIYFKCNKCGHVETTSAPPPPEKPADSSPVEAGLATGAEPDSAVGSTTAGSVGEINARKEAQKAFENASQRIKDAFLAIDDKPIAQMSMAGAIKAARWLNKQIDLEAGQ